MVLDIPNISAVIVAAIPVVGGVYTAVKRIRKSSKAKKDTYRAEILAEAKEEATKVKTELENKLKVLEEEFQVQKRSVSKDFSHFREVYSAEVKVLGEKIENLRQDLSAQHTALVGLLTKLVDR